MNIMSLKSLLLAASFMLAPAAQAAGMILIDPVPGMPIVPVHPVPVHPIVVPPPGHPAPPGHPVTPPPGHRPVLKGTVSYGLHLKNADIKVDITDQIAKTYITQTFSNDTDRNLAGTYLFPLPDDTTFSSFSLHIDGKPVEGKILEANEARQQYEEIVRRMVDPGLLEYADYKTVRARIFPIPAHGTKKVELEYTQILKAENGLLKYKFPLKAEGESDPADEIKVNVKLNSKQGLRTIWSPSHTISVNKSSDHMAKVAYLGKDTVPDKDFVLYYNISDKDLAANILTHKDTGEDGYYLFTVTPPVEAKQTSAKDIVLVVDTSGSMRGDRLDQSKKALKYLINALNPGDRFSIVQFNTDVDLFNDALLPATADNKKKAESFVNDLEAHGGTNVSDALKGALTMLDHASDRPGYLVLMTDGEPTVGETNVANLVKSIHPKRDIRLFDFGVGYDVNTRLLNKLAEQHHGTAQYVEPSENLEMSLSSFYQKIKSPVLSNVKITYDGVQVKDVYPRDVKDIFAGSQVLLLGRYKTAGKGSIKLTGTVNGVQKAYSFPVALPSEAAGNTYLPRLWAMRRIGHLTEVAQENGDTREVVDEIVALSKKYGIISNYTSFLVTDPSENHRLANGISPMPMPMPMAPLATSGVRAHGAFRASPAPMAMPRLAVASGGGGGGFASGVRFFNAPTSMQIADDRAVMKEERRGRSLKKVVNIVSTAGTIASLPPPPMPTGRDAVINAKLVSSLKDSESLDAKTRADGVKSVEDKTFYLQDGVWTDSSYTPGKVKLTTVKFGSKEYFDLLRSKPQLSKFFAVGQQVVVGFHGTWYKVTS